MSHYSQPAVVDLQYRQNLTDRIFDVLRCNGSNARGVYFRLDNLPKGGMKALLRQRPLDAVRAEVGGPTLTVEITTERKGEQPDPDALRFATYDYDEFRTWLYRLLRRHRMQPATAVHTSQSNSRPTSALLRPDLRPRPTFHRKQKKGR